MKDYNEMAESVFERRDKYIVERSRQMKKVTSILYCFCLVALLGIGTGVIPKQEPLDSGDVNCDGNYYSADDYSKQEQAEEKDKSILLISSYESGGEACYKAPCDGDVYMSIPLSRAIETYGDNAHYQVLVQVFKNGFPLDSESVEVQAEMERLTALRYPIVFENGTSYAFSLIASNEQLQSIPSGKNYGYMLFLYGEFFDDLNEVSETDSDAAKFHVDAPVQGESSNTGALTAYETVWGGSYMNEEGRWVIWLTENTTENQQEVFKRNPELNKETTIFKTADYSYAYLTALMADISNAMGTSELPHISSAALREEMNRVEVGMTADDAESIAQVMAFDTVGSAIEIRTLSGYAVTKELVKGPAK